MGQKIHPTGFRLAVNKDWSSKWFAKSRDFSVVLKKILMFANIYVNACPMHQLAVLLLRGQPNLLVLLFSRLGREW